MIDSFFLAVEQTFFLRSLLVVVLLAIVFPLYGNIVVVRQEANIAHTFAHIALLGVAVGLWFDWPITTVILSSVVLTVFFLFFLGLRESQNQVVHNEIGAQFGLVGAILIVSQMSGYRADISSYLFGDVLLLSNYDVLFVALIVLVSCLLYFIFWKKRYALSLHKSLARSKNISPAGFSFLYLLALGLIIAGAMKVIGVLLVSAFLILPSNVGKLIAKNKKQWDLISIGFCCLMSVVALFFSWHRDLPSGASIVGFLLCSYLFVLLASFFS